MREHKGYDEWIKVVSEELSKYDEPSLSTYKEIARKFNLSYSEVFDLSGESDYLSFCDGED